MGSFNPEMLVLARELAGLTQAELADALAASQAEVSKIESGIREPSDDQIVKIAKQVKCPSEFLYLSESIKNFSTACMYHRKRQSTTQAVLRRLRALVNKRRIQVKRLLLAAEVGDNLFPRLDLDEYQGGPAEIARILRAAWKMPPGPVANLTATVEEAGGIVIRCDFGTNKVDAVSQWHPDSPPLFFINTTSPSDRMRFSLAHEIGHVVMHQLLTDDVEREADRFASEFLMPAADIAPYLSDLTLPKLAALKPFWKTSMAALIKRATDLEKITDRNKNYLWFRMGQLGYRTREPVTLAMESPALLYDIVDLHRRELGYSTSDLAKLLVTSEEEVKAEFLYQSTGLMIVK